MKNIIIIISLLIYGSSFSQKKLLDSAILVQQQADKFVDSLTRNTSLKSFQEFLFEVEGAKRYATFLEQYNFFIKQKYDVWIQQTNKPKTAK